MEVKEVLAGSALILAECCWQIYKLIIIVSSTQNIPCRTNFCWNFCYYLCKSNTDMQEANKIEPEEDFPQESAEVQPDSVESDPETDLLESPSQEGDDFYERVEIVADQRQSPIRLDKYLIDRLAAISRNKLQITIRAGGVLVDEKPVKPNYKVRPGNRINVILTRSFDDDQKLFLIYHSVCINLTIEIDFH